MIQLKIYLIESYDKIFADYSLSSSCYAEIHPTYTSNFNRLYKNYGHEKSVVDDHYSFQRDQTVSSGTPSQLCL